MKVIDKYYNNNSYSITDTALKVVLPSETEYLAAAPVLSSQEKNILNFTIGEIDAHTQGVIIIKVKVSEDAENNSVLIFGATLNYTDANDEFNSIDSYITAAVKHKEGLLASVFDAFKGILSGVWLWLILVLIAAGYSAWHFGRKSSLLAEANK